MKYEGDVNYAANPYGYPPAPRRRRGLIGLGLSVVGIAAFAGVVLYAYKGRDRTGPDGGPPLLEADATPTKLRPEQPGGMEVPHQDKLVFDRLNHGAKDGKPPVEHLLPPPEAPLPRPVVTPPVPALSAGPLPPALAALPAPAEPVPAVTPPPAPVAAPAAVQPVAMAKAPPPATKAPAPSVPASQPASVAVTPAPVPVAAPAAGGGGYRVQLASVRSEAEAAAEWKRLSGRHAELGGLSLLVSKADLGEKGIFYRVQGGSVDEARARSICDKLKSLNVGCVVVRP